MNGAEGLHRVGNVFRGRTLGYDPVPVQGVCHDEEVGIVVGKTRSWRLESCCLYVSKQTFEMRVRVVDVAAPSVRRVKLVTLVA